MAYDANTEFTRFEPHLLSPAIGAELIGADLANFDDTLVDEVRAADHVGVPLAKVLGGACGSPSSPSAVNVLNSWLPSSGSKRRVSFDVFW